MAASAVPVTLALAATLWALAGAQPTQCPPTVPSQLHQLTVGGCPITVRDTGAPGGPYLEVEPLMCVTGNLHGALPRYDAVTRQTYVSVAVTLRDDAMLAEIQRQVRHLSPKSVKFARVSDVSVSTDASSAIQVLGFDWTPEGPQGVLRLGCVNEMSNCSGVLIALELRCDQFNVLDTILLTATITNDSSSTQLNYRLTVQNQSMFDASLRGPTHLPECCPMRFFKSVKQGNCVARVHQWLDKKGHFLIEPLLCHNLRTVRSEPVLYDYSRDMHYLKLDVVLQDEVTVDAVRSQMDISPRSVSFMRLWRAQSHVAASLSRRFEIGGLMASGDGRSGQVRVYCRDEDDCKNLKIKIRANPFRLWRHVKWSVTSLVDSTCAHTSAVRRYFSEAMLHKDTGDADSRRWPVSCRVLGLVPGSSHCHVAFLPQGRSFVVVQQRTSSRVSFQQSWADYEKGFGDQSDFWIGLSSIHLLSKNGTTLRVEMKLWNGTELHAEYSGFQVGDASTNYRMTYREMLRDRSSVRFDSMGFHRGMEFSTMDRDNDYSSSFCSDDWGKGGWWFNDCFSFNPNGLFPRARTEDFSYVIWNENGRHFLLREVRLMLLI